jgi:hypothetical protein
MQAVWYGLREKALRPPVFPIPLIIIHDRKNDLNYSKGYLLFIG